LVVYRPSKNKANSELSGTDAYTTYFQREGWQYCSQTHRPGALIPGNQPRLGAQPVRASRGFPGSKTTFPLHFARVAAHRVRWHVLCFLSVSGSNESALLD